MKHFVKKLKKTFKNFFKDKWNIAIAVLIVLVIGLGISVIGLLKTSLLIVVIVALVIALKYGGNAISHNKKNDKHEKKEKTHRKKKNKWLNITIILVLCLGIGGMLAGIGFMGYIVVSAPKFDTQKLYFKEASIIYDKNNKEITRIGKEMRDKVTFDELPQVFVDAIVATEDSRYFEHNGFDLPRFMKASAGQVLGNSSAGGASTISMQVIKNNFTSTNQSIVRKFTDIYLSVFKLEKNYTKEQILEFYVNDLHLGVNNTLGVGATAKGLFGKDIGDINLSQAALLAGMFQAPSSYNPYKYPEKAEARRHTVLYLMNRHGYITTEQMKIADSMPIESIIVPQESTGHPYQGYIDYVTDEVFDKTGYDPLVVPMKIYTNLDTTKQDYLNGILDGTNFKQWENDVVQAGIAAVDVHNGAILALGTGRNRPAKSISFASDIKEQLGSTAKPLFDYGPGMEYNNWSTYTPFVDDVYSYTNGPQINNWNNTYMGMMTLRNALAESRNIPALKAFQQVDNKKIIEFVQSLGITPEVENGRIHEAHSIGGFNGSNPLELAAAYAAFANGGYYIEPYSVNKIELIDSGEVETYKPEKTRVMSDSTAFMITDILKYGVDNRIIGGGRTTGVEVAAKSGTSNYDQATKTRYGLASNAINDLWYGGYSPDIAIGMWYGYDGKISSAHYSKSPSSSIIRDRLFTAIANGIFDRNGSKFTVPSSVVKVTIERNTIPAMLPSPFTPSNMITAEYFKKGTEPTEVSPRFNTLANVTGLDAEKDGSNVKITWKAVQPVDMLTSGYLATIAAQKDKYTSIYRNEDASLLGTIGYNVYLKNEDGSLTLLGWTDKTSYTHKPTTSGSLTYIVKTCYSIFKSSQSTGSTTTLSDSPYVAIITMNLSGASTINLTKGQVYTDPGVKVLKDSANVTDKATIKITVKNNTTEVETEYDKLSEIILNTTTATSYTITYDITYEGNNEELTRTVNVTE